MGRFVGVRVSAGEGVWSSECWRLTQAALAPEGEPARLRLRIRAAPGGEWLTICILSPERPAVAFDVVLEPGAAIGCESLGDGSGTVHILGWQRKPSRALMLARLAHLAASAELGNSDDGEADESEFARRAAELNREREEKKRRESLGSASSTTKRSPRLTFNPKVLVAEYVPKRVGISPERGFADLSKMEERAQLRVATDMVEPLHPLVEPSGTSPPSQPLPLRQPARGVAKAVPMHSPAAARETPDAAKPKPREVLGAAEMQRRMSSLIAAEAGSMAHGRADAAEATEDSLERLAEDLRPTNGDANCNCGSLGSSGRPVESLLQALLQIRSAALRASALEAAEAIEDMRAACALDGIAGSSGIVRLLRECELATVYSEGIEALIRDVSAAVNSDDVLSVRTRLRLLLHVDGLYFATLYADVQGGTGRGVALDRLSGKQGLLDPAAFLRASHPPTFGRAAMAAMAGPVRMVKQYGGWLKLAAEMILDCSMKESLVGQANPLFNLWKLRFAEASELLGSSGVASAAEYAKVAPLRSSAADKEPPAPALVRKWRRLEREWPCWMLAFAVPSEEALQQIAELNVPVVEMGGGVGYWAELLRQRGVAVECYDSTPTSTTRGGGRAHSAQMSGSNTFHGQNPPWGEVLRGTPKTLASERFKTHALLMCYPPPRSRMAADCLAAFTGNIVIHVGEWMGDTGNTAFEKALAQGWFLERRLALPCWGDTVEDCTMWRRRSSPTTTMAHPVLKCDGCLKCGTLRPATAKDAPGVLRR